MATEDLNMLNCPKMSLEEQIQYLIELGYFVSFSRGIDHGNHQWQDPSESGIEVLINISKIDLIDGKQYIRDQRGIPAFKGQASFGLQYLIDSIKETK